jgi:acyl-homoserine lactone acylase PvdQ
LALDVFAPGHDDRAADAPVARSRLAEAAARLRDGFGRIDPRLDEVQRLQHDAVGRGLGGAPDVLHAIYTRPGQRGRRLAHSGDSLVLLVDWDADGRVSARAVQPFGAAPNRPGSPHRSDQAELFARRQLRPVWFDEAEVRAHLESELRLGASGPVDTP